MRLESSSVRPDAAYQPLSAVTQRTTAATTVTRPVVLMLPAPPHSSSATTDAAFPPPGSATLRTTAETVLTRASSVQRKLVPTFR